MDDCIWKIMRGTFPLTLWMGSTTTATARSDSASKLCCVLMSTPDSQQPKPGWLWYQPTTISGLQQQQHHSIIYASPVLVIWNRPLTFDLSLYLPVCFNMSNIFAWKTGSTASTLTPCQHNSHYTGKSKILTPLIKGTGWKTYDEPK